MTLGEKIQNLRKINSISQKQLAMKLDVAQKDIENWELNISMPDVSKIVMISELFLISVDELIKETSSNNNVLKLEQVYKFNLAHNQILIGFITAVIGMIILIIDFMFLPIFGLIQKEQLNGKGFYTDFIKYATMQPMPFIFIVTGILILSGICFLLKGSFYKKHISLKGEKFKY